MKNLLWVFALLTLTLANGIGWGNEPDFNIVGGSQVATAKNIEVAVPSFSIVGGQTRKKAAIKKVAETDYDKVCEEHGRSLIPKVGENATEPTTQTPTYAAPAGDGWQWDASREIWWRPAPAPEPALVTTMPIVTQNVQTYTVPLPAYRPAPIAAPFYNPPRPSTSIMPRFFRGNSGFRSSGSMNCGPSG